MKNFLLLLTLLTGICHSVSTPAQVINLDRGITRAVVIGISDYQNLPDLQFAHRDAEAFAAWLQSKSGGSLPPENILLLLNGQATAGKVGMAFLWLVSESKEGDRAIVYFSGHGDVESKLLNQPGYLLCWDSPANVYMGSGSPSISDIQNVVGTLTLGNKAKVLFITDACRSGHLAGAAIDGVQITNNNLAKPFANEVKILSCQPNELSLEGAQWGGGRGVFSYNLLDGLYGLADRDSDSQVKVKEISRYLEDMVSAQADPQAQNPMVIGDREALLAFVSGEDLAKIKDLKRQEQPTFSPGGKRGYEAALLAKVDTNLQEMYKSFLAAIESGHLMPSAAPKGQAGGLSADDCYRMLIKEPDIQQLHGSMTRTLVAALADEAQQVVNKLLRTDPQIIDEAFPGRVRYAHLPAYLARAAEILGEQHYMYRYLKCKQYFFEAKTLTKEKYPDLSPDSLFKLSVQALDKALEYDSDAAYAHLEKGLSYYWHSSLNDTALAYFNKAMTLSPQWVLAVYYYGRTLAEIEWWNGIPPTAGILYLKESLKYDSTFLPIYERLGFFETSDKKKYWQNLYVQKTKRFISEHPESIPATYYRYLGWTLQYLKRFDEMENVVLKFGELTNYEDPVYWKMLGFCYLSLGRYEDALGYLKKYTILRPNDIEGWFHLVITHLALKQQKEAVRCAKDALEKFPNDGWGSQLLAFIYTDGQEYDSAIQVLQASLVAQTEPRHYYLRLGQLYEFIGKPDIAMSYYQKLLPTKAIGFWLDWYCHAVPYRKLGMEDKFNETLREWENQESSDSPQWEWSQACLYAFLGENEQSLAWLEKAFQNGFRADFSIGAIFGSFYNPDMHLIRETTEFKALVKKYLPDYYKD